MGMSLFSSFRWKKKGSPKSTRRVRGRKRIRRGDNLVSPEIPLELQIEILTRLPPKSLMRFKCVSKLWFSHIRSRYFSKRHLTVESPPRLYMSLTDTFQCPLMEVCHNPGKSLLVSLTSSSSSNGESFDQDLTMPGMGGHDMVVLRGLILYDLCRKECIYNPTTRQRLTLPAVKSNIFAQEEPHKYVDFFLGHDSVLDQYKVVCSVAIASKDFERITSEHWVFVLEAGGSGKRIEFDQQPHRPLHPGVCIDGVIYYLADTSIYNDIVVSFDVRSEEFSMINAPDVVSQIAKSVGFTEYGGKPAILDHTDLVEFGSVELLVVEDGGKWSKKSLVLQPCQMHLLDNSINVEVEGTTRKGEFFLTPIPRLPVPMYSLDYILYYDLQRNDLRKVDIIRGISEHEFIDPYTHLKLMDKCESIMHLEI